MSIPELKLADNGFYYVHWTEGRRSKRISTREKDVDAAQAFFGQWLLMEKNAPAAGGHLTCADLWALYDAKHVETKLAAPATADYSWKNLEPHFGKLTLGQVDQDVVTAYEDKRATGDIGRPSKPSTVRRELQALRASWGWCADPKRKIIARADIPAFDLPAESSPRDRWLRMDEIKKLIAGAESMRRGTRLSRLERFLWLALETAARMTAILELTWDRVDFETGMIHYDVPGRKKTKKRRASVPISNTLRPVLERAYAERTSIYVCDNQGAMWASVQLAAIAAGFGGAKPARGEKPKATGISPHVLRHTAATHMARRGVELYTIAGVLGNSLAMVEKVYAKHCPSRLAAAVNAISGGVLEAAQ